jgi:S-adenosyl methyltransferase
MYNFYLGGTDNFAADRVVVEKMMTADPDARTSVLENRRFLRRAVKFLAGEGGVDQFLDIGTGIPSADNTHEVAHRRPASSTAITTAGLELVEPGIVPVSQWRAEHESQPRPTPAQAALYGAVARKS